MYGQARPAVDGHLTEVDVYAVIGPFASATRIGKVRVPKFDTPEAHATSKVEIEQKLKLYYERVVTLDPNRPLSGQAASFDSTYNYSSSSEAWFLTGEDPRRPYYVISSPTKEHVELQAAGSIYAKLVKLEDFITNYYRVEKVSVR